MKKIKKSVRLNPYNAELVQSIADVMFDGNFSIALNFVIRMLKNDSNFAGLCKYITFKSRYDRGERSSVVIRGKEEFDKALFSIVLSQKNSTKHL